VNINSASADQLTALPGIGPSYAQRIVEYREKNGPFKRVEDILNVRGIGEKTFEKIRERITIGAAVQ
jgi:competence protein ComEA